MKDLFSMAQLNIKSLWGEPPFLPVGLGAALGVSLGVSGGVVNDASTCRQLPLCAFCRQATGTTTAWRDRYRSSVPFASCHQSKIKSLWGNHNLCHICRGYCNVAQSFDRLKSWKIDSSFSSVKQLQLLQTPFPEKHSENPEAEPYVGRDGAGKTFSLKLHSYRPEWQHLTWRPEMFRWSRSNLEMDLAADLQESQRMAPTRKQEVKHPVDLHVYNCI